MCNKIIKIKTVFLSQITKQPINFVNNLISTLTIIIKRTCYAVGETR